MWFTKDIHPPDALIKSKAFRFLEVMSLNLKHYQDSSPSRLTLSMMVMHPNTRSDIAIPHHLGRYAGKIGHRAQDVETAETMSSKKS